MRKKRIYAAALAGALVLGTALGNGTSAQAVAEDWFRFETDEQGEQQPVVGVVRYGEYQYWGISYGYTLHPDYKYILRLPYDEAGYGYKDDGDGDGYSYYEAMDYTDLYNYPKAVGIELTNLPWSNDALGLLTASNIPAEKELLVLGDWTGDQSQYLIWNLENVQQAFASGYMLVYDQTNTLVDSFPLMSGAPTDNTTPVPDTTTSVPAETVPAPDTTASVPAEMVLNIDSITPDTATPGAGVNENAPSDNRTVEAVAREVLQGKWGVGKERQIRLEAAGYNYEEVQKKVRGLMK